MKKKEKEMKYENEQMNEEEARGLRNVKVASAFIVIICLVGFLAITYFTGYIGDMFGKTGENIALGVIGLLLIFALYKNNKNL